MTTYFYSQGAANALLDAVIDGAKLYSQHDDDIAWLEQVDGSRQAVEWALFEQLVNTGALLPMAESGRTHWTLPDKIGLSRFSM